MVTATDKRQVIKHSRQYSLSERHVCQLLHYPRSTMRYQSVRTERDKQFIQQVRDCALDYPRFGYRRIAVMLSRPDAVVNAKRVYRIWRDEQLALPKRRKRRRLGQRTQVPINPAIIYFA